ncbi:GGDEF domain-containing protein [Sphingomonas aracearum]|uniref:GGDEF domain-containing protein n=1 Tax=Sphingomonas aracearum TaxID=2283317 RepID=A0A369W290_9SPHN|nr:GGDEF domain-containing protein [Sphingomonas aracearum]
MYVLSFHQRDELAMLAAEDGWQVIAARRAVGAEQRFASSGAAVAVVDARGALGDGVGATGALGAVAAEQGAALLVLVAPSDLGALPRFFEAGATHFLCSPFGRTEFLQALRFAGRYAERLAGSWGAATARTLGWRFDPSNGKVHLTAELSRLLAFEEAVSTRTLLRQLPQDERAAVVSRLRGLTAARRRAVFAHDLPGLGRFVQHVQLDPQSGRVEAIAEPLGTVPDAGELLRDAMVGISDIGGARRWLGRELEEGRRTDLQVMLVSLNRFEMVNTSYGRRAGDALLRAALGRIDLVARQETPHGAFLARTAGSEYLIALHATAAQVADLARSVAAALARPFVAGDSIIVLGSRIGVAMAQQDDTASTLLRRASEALAEARDADGVTMRVAGTIPDLPLDRLAADLRQAIGGGEIQVLFQPQVTIATRAITGVEALARWSHPEFGTIGAEALFAAAQRADIEVPLSDHIQRIVLEQAAAWPRLLAGLRLSLNLTAGDIARPGFADLFLDRVDASGFPRNRLTLEITESGLIDDLGVAAGLLNTLRQAGCRVAIDDFGTGYSSLAYLKSLPLDYLKIDKKLAQDIGGTARDRVVVRGVIEMARSLGLAVIAEGVETDEQLDLLAKEGCQLFQGFLCAGPLAVAELVELMGE